MKVIHSYVNKHGLIPKELIYVQYLSMLLAKKHYGNISFYGDKRTCDVIRELGFEYDEINDTLLKLEDADTFSVVKLKVFESMSEPFLHLDCDTLLLNRIDFESYKKDYLFSHRDLVIPKSDKDETMKNLYFTWFLGMVERDDEILKSKYPFKDAVTRFKGYIPENILLSAKELYHDYYLMNNYYTNLFFDIIEKVGKDIFNEVHFESIPNMNITYVKKVDKFRLATIEALKHYYDNKKRIDIEPYGACYVEQFILHTQLRFIDKKYKKSSNKCKNFIFSNSPTVQFNEDNQVGRIDKITPPYILSYNNDRHFKCNCCGEEIISSLSEKEGNNYDEFVIKDFNTTDDLIKIFDQNFNGFLHLSHLKWSDLFQLYVIHKIRSMVGAEKIRQIHQFYKKEYPLMDLPETSRAEKFYTNLTRFKFEKDIV